MNRLFRSNSTASSSSMASLSPIPNIINQEEHEYQDLTADYFENWNIPKIPVKEIYRSSFLTDSSFVISSCKYRKWVFFASK
ncbi:hypothetical protein RHMOL_Rhmol04G0135100 [Rhododendron molle]|uniref:Uncharacterized protein n=1 Tax=Rhododendron molle TaxID=49168 RepID=A0ACC0P2I5_RHOML|nr:hypothetical protein RHMOL_Rhmol04G0135100 [Rhododendron molle]